MKTRLSYKDLLLLLGILVAIIVAFTTMVYSDQPSDEAKQEVEPVKKTSVVAAPVKVLKKVFEFVVTTGKTASKKV